MKPDFDGSNFPGFRDGPFVLMAGRLQSGPGAASIDTAERFREFAASFAAERSRLH
jgi:hypothetical protein